ncbi:MAG: hypothetical protein IPK58_13505 [Acidobacteria bacterium]|nr:hypothetical protein [Acidobacteriota bacterium]
MCGLLNRFGGMTPAFPLRESDALSARVQLHPGYEQAKTSISVRFGKLPGFSNGGTIRANSNHSKISI